MRNKPWHKTRVIEMGMREQDEVDVMQIEVQRVAILAIGFASALKQSAIDQIALAAILDKIF